MIRTRTKLIISGIIFVIIGGVVSGTVYSAFSATTTNGTNTYTAGTVTLTDNDGGSALFTTFTNMKPGDTATKCIKVDYTGSLSSTVKLYHALSGGTLGQYLTLQINRGSFSGAVPASNQCTGFSSAASIYNGNMSSFPTTYAGGLNEGTWTNGTSNVYQITVTLQDVNAAKGDTASETFTWEAQNQ